MSATTAWSSRCGPSSTFPNLRLPQTSINIALRSTADPILLANAMRKAVLAVDPQQPVFDIQTMDQRVSDLVAQRRLIMLLIACFALLAVILSAVGVYGVFAYSVSQRTQEMGIRLALGASRRGLLGLIVAQAARLIAAGGILGIAGALPAQPAPHQHAGRRQAARCPLLLARLDSHDRSRAPRQHHPRIARRAHQSRLRASRRVDGRPKAPP